MEELYTHFFGMQAKKFEKMLGEYRIIFYVGFGVLYVVLVGKRNDSDVYKKLDRLM